MACPIRRCRARLLPVNLALPLKPYRPRLQILMSFHRGVCQQKVHLSISLQQYVRYAKAFCLPLSQYRGQVASTWSTNAVGVDRAVRSQDRVSGAVGVAQSYQNLCFWYKKHGHQLAMCIWSNQTVFSDEMLF